MTMVGLLAVAVVVLTLTGAISWVWVLVFGWAVLAWSAIKVVRKQGAQRARRRAAEQLQENYVFRQG